MPYLDKTTKYDRRKGHVDFKCLYCDEPVKVNNEGELYSGITNVLCPYCQQIIELETFVEVTYIPSIYIK